MKIHRPLFVCRFVVTFLAASFMLTSMTSCSVHKNDFHKKKWSIKKGHPPAQRYYNKWSLLNPHRQ